MRRRNRRTARAFGAPFFGWLNLHRSYHGTNVGFRFEDAHHKVASVESPTEESPNAGSGEAPKNEPERRRIMAEIPKVDIASPRFKASAHPYYARLRAESPVHRVPMAGKSDAWLLTRYKDVDSVLADDRFAKDKLNALTPEQADREPWMPRDQGARTQHARSRRSGSYTAPKSGS